MEDMLDILLIGSVGLIVSVGVEPESVGASTGLTAMVTVFCVGYESSGLLGSILCMSYLSALLILFLFFISLCPSSMTDDDLLTPIQSGSLVIFVGVSGGFCDFLCGVSDEAEMNALALSGIGIFFYSYFACYLVLLACYLFLGVVIISKLCKRSKGALSPAL